jgi:hypothetical protein
MRDVKFVAEGVFVGKVNTTSVGGQSGRGIVLTDFVINNSIQDGRGTVKEQPLKITAYNKNAALLDAINIGERVLVNGYVRGKYNEGKDEYWTNLVMQTIQII